MKSLLAAAALVLAVALATPAVAAPFAFAVNGSDDLYELNLTPGAATFLGNLGPNPGDFFDGATVAGALALGPDGTLYATNSSDPTSLHTVATSGPPGTALVQTSVPLTNVPPSGNTGGVDGLDFNGDVLLATNFFSTPRLLEIDESTGAVVDDVPSSPNGTGRAQAFAVVNGTTGLFVANNSLLYQIDLANGAVLEVGDLGAGLQVEAIDVDPLTDALYFLDNDQAFRGTFTLGSMSTPGSVTVLSVVDTRLADAMGNPTDTDVTGWTGMTLGALAAVPEPASPLLVVAGAAALVAIRRRRRR